MTDRVLLDTNVLVYAYDLSNLSKQQRSAEVLNHFVTAGLGVISTQVLAEFFSAVTRKIAGPLSAADAYVRLEDYIASWVVVDLSPWIVLADPFRCYVL